MSVQAIANLIRSGDQIALVGARDAPSEALDFFRSLAAFIVRRGGMVVTGGAEGVDQAAIDGGNEEDPSHVSVILPWNRYNTRLHPQNRVRVNIVTQRQIDLVNKALPYAGNLRPSHLSLHARNVAIVDESAAVVAWPSPRTNGTRCTMEVARLLNRPVSDVSDPKVRRQLEEALWPAR